MADGTLLGDDPVLVCEKWIQLLVQAVHLMGQSVRSRKRKKKKKKDQAHFLRATDENTDLSHIRDIKNCFQANKSCRDSESIMLQAMCR